MTEKIKAELEETIQGLFQKEDRLREWRLSIKLCLEGGSSRFLKAGLKDGIELWESGRDCAGDGSPSAVVQR